MSDTARALRQRRPRAFQRIVAKVREDVFSGRLAAGDRLPSESAFAEEFRVSRLAVREALRVLELEGLVRVEHGFRGGAFVARADTAPVSRALETMLRIERLDRSEIYTARRYLEPVVASLAARAPSEDTLRALRENIDEGERRLATGGHAFAVNLDFHAILAAACGNRILALMTDAILELLSRVEAQLPSDRVANREASAAHRGILEAVERGDGAVAEERMTRHLAWLEDHYRSASKRRNER